MKNLGILLVAIFFITLSCRKSDTFVEKQGMEITMGSICGWCTGYDTLIINKLDLHYNYDNPCDDNKDFTDNRLTSEQLWNDLMKKFLPETFKKLNVNSNHHWADGCDTWLEVKNGDYYHKIQFGYPELRDMDSDIKPFIQLIDSLRVELRNQ